MNYFIFVRMLLVMVELMLVLHDCGAVDVAVKSQDGHQLFPEFQNELRRPTNSEKHLSRISGKLPFKSRSSDVEYHSSFFNDGKSHQQHSDAGFATHSPLLTHLFQPSVLSQEDTFLNSKNGTFGLNSSVENASGRDILRKIGNSFRLSNRPVGIIQNSKSQNDTNEKHAKASDVYHMDLNTDHKSRLTSKPTSITPDNQNNQNSIRFSAEAARQVFGKYHKSDFDSFSVNDNLKDKDTPSVLFGQMTPIIGRVSPRRIRRDLFIKNKRFPALLEIVNDIQRAYGTANLEFDHVRNNEELNETPYNIFAKENPNTALEHLHLNIPEHASIIEGRQYSKPQIDLLLEAISEIYSKTPGNGRMLDPNQSVKRNFDTIDSGSLSAINQNFHSHLGPATRPRKPALYQLRNRIKRQFDAIGTGYFLGLSQNHVGKRILHPTEDPKLRQIFQNQIYKRNFDVIGGGILSGLKQNHFGKRNFKFFPNDNILKYLRQNGIDRKLARSAKIASENSEGQYAVENREFGSFSNDNPAATNRRFLNTQLFGNDNINDIWTNKNDASFFDRARSDISQDSIDTKIYPKGNVRSEDIDPLFLEKRLDIISDDALGGIRQNFLDKKYTNSFQKESLPEFGKNFAQPRYFNSFGRRFVEANRLNMNPNIYFNSPSVLWGLDNSIRSKRNIPRYLSHNFNELLQHKRNFDSISLNSMNQFDQNFMGRQKVDNRRSFDSISKNYMDRLSHNSPRNSNFFQGNILNEDIRSLSKKRRFPFGGLISLKGNRYLDLFPQMQFQEEGLGHFLRKRSRGNPKLYDGLHDLVGDSPDELLRVNLFPFSRFTFSKWMNPSKLLQNNVGMRDSTFQARQDGGDIVRSGVGLMNLRDNDAGSSFGGNIYDDSIEKRTFDPINSVSSLSGIDQNFVKSSSVKSSRLGSSPRRLFTKRTVVDKESTLGNDDDEVRLLNGPNLLFEDSNGEGEESVENEEQYFSSWTPRLDRQRFFFGDVNKDMADRILDVEDTDRGSDVIYDTGLDNARASKEDDENRTGENPDGNGEPGGSSSHRVVSN